LKWCRRICRWLGASLPKIVFLPVLAEECQDLQALGFGDRFEAVGEPRWDQVFARAQAGSDRASQLLNHFRELKRPWGVLAQIWPEDLASWETSLSQAEGTLWVVPHQVGEASIKKTEEFLRQKGLQPLRSSMFREQSALHGETPVCILVDEVGFLLELYSGMDWAYVGGGFGVSVHSTIEPAVHGLPIAIGPRGYHRFSEIQVLERSGELTVVQDSQGLSDWLRSIANVSESDEALREKWRAQAKARTGATQRCLRILSEVSVACPGG
jgi:3-deoxy-D-manno-octulosonic-acid transferase